jgi:cation:H+ antiporter
MVWIKFLTMAAVIVAAATQLAKYGDIIAVRTKLGGMFIGVLLLAGATSLPEVLTSISALRQNSPDLAAGNLLGSNSFNMLLLAILDIVNRKQRILRKAALKHALSGSLAIFLIGMVVFFILADVDVRIGWVGIDSILIIFFYIIAVWLIQGNQPRPGLNDAAAEIPDNTTSLRRGIVGFLVAAGVLVIATPIMVQSADEIALLTGLGATFIGTTLVALVTSLPELVTTIAAIKIGADDMAIGNLFGSNMFNMFAVGLTDVFFLKGRFLGEINPSFALVGMLGLLMTGIGLVGNLAKLEKKIWLVEIDALLLILVYFAGMFLLFIKGT